MATYQRTPPFRGPVVRPRMDGASFKTVFRGSADIRGSQARPHLIAYVDKLEYLLRDTLHTEGTN